MGAVTPEGQAAEAFANELLDTQNEPSYNDPESKNDPEEVEAEDTEADGELDAGAEADGDSGSDQDAAESPDDDESGDDESGEMRFVEIEINGTKYEVPEELKDGYLMQADYTRKTQSLQDYKKEVELTQKQLMAQQQEHQFIQEIQPDINNLGYLQAQINQIEENLQTNLSNLSSEDLFRQKIQADGLKEQAQRLKAQLESKYGEFQKSQEQAYRELLNQGAEVLKQTIPNWSPEKQAQVRDFALQQGFTEQEVSSIIDPRHVRVLWAAAEYERLQAKGPKVAEKVTKQIKTKARNPMPKDVRTKLDNRKKLKSKNTSSDDKARIIGEEAADWFFKTKG